MAHVDRMGSNKYYTILEYISCTHEHHLILFWQVPGCGSVSGIPLYPRTDVFCALNALTCLAMGHQLHKEQYLPDQRIFTRVSRLGQHRASPRDPFRSCNNCCLVLRLYP